MNPNLFTGPRLAFLVGVPLAWAVLLVFHGSGPDNGVYESLRDEASRFTAVHVGSTVFVGLFGLALYLLARDLPGRAARISRLATGTFVLFYAAGEAINGIASGVLVNYTNDAPIGERPALAAAAQDLYHSGAAGWIIGVGSVAGVLAGHVGLVLFAAGVALIANRRTTITSVETPTSSPP